MDRNVLSAINEKWAIIPERLDGIMERIAVHSLSITEFPDNGPNAGYEIQGGVAIIPVRGVLTKRPGFLSMLMGATAMETVGANVKAALNDASVKGILLNVDSPGGTVDGAAALADIIFKSKGKKPIVAYCDGMMASAAYWIGSAADYVMAPKTGEVGSIGIVQAHYDYSAADKKAGLKRTYLYAGKYKTAGNDAEPLSQTAREVIQAGVDYVYSLFVDAVSNHRAMPLAEVLALADGKLFIGEQTVGIGLVDEIGGLSSAIAKVKDLAVRFDRFKGNLTEASTFAARQANTKPARIPGPRNFTEAWQQIKEHAQCSTEDALKQAVRKFPDLHKIFIYGQQGHA